MFILGSGCGWIPAAPIKFMASIIDIIKVLTPVYLVIMGSIGFGKAIISQKEDEIKKAQSSFIKKIIAGAAVFFVIVFAEWITNLITKVGGDASGAMSCVNALLNNSYSADDTDYYDPPENTNSTSSTNNTSKTTTINPYADSCWAQVQKREGYEGFSSYQKCKQIMMTQHKNDELTASTFCQTLCNENPYQPSTTLNINTTNIPGIGNVPLVPTKTTTTVGLTNIFPIINNTYVNELLDPTSDKFDQVLFNEQIQKSYEDSDCWDKIEGTSGYGACWSSFYYNTKPNIPGYTEEDAKQQCMKMCDEAKRKN